MKRYSTLFLSFFMFLFFSFLQVNTVFCTEVQENEALKLADYWYTAEINSGHIKMSKEDTANRLNALSMHQVLYMTSATTILDTYPENEPVLAYIIKYQPTGWVIVSSDDEIQPIIAFDIQSEFRWDQPELNFMHGYLGKEMSSRWARIRTNRSKGLNPVHPNWKTLRSMMQNDQAPQTSEGDTVPAGPAGTNYLLLDTALWGQGTNYNETVIAHNGNTAGIPTGCTATAMAIQMRFHSWPNWGNSSHSYSDLSGTVTYYHSRNYGTTSYNWALMPSATLTEANADVANLMYDCGVAVNMNYEVGNSAAWPSAANTNTFFRYKGTTQLTSSHDIPIRDSVLAHLPVVISSSAHTVVVSGYRDTLSPYYYINAGWNGASNGWYSLDTMPGGDSTIDRSYPYSSPDNYIFVNNGWSGTENGNLQNPYTTISNGVSHVPVNGQLWIKSGVYTGTGNVPMTFTTPMTVHGFDGLVTIQ